MSRFHRGQLWDEMPWILCQDNEVNPFTGRAYIIPGSVTLSRDVITYGWHYAWGPTQCWLHAGTCKACQRKFVAETEMCPGNPLTERLQTPFRFCDNCTAKRKAKNSSATSRRYRERNRTAPAQKHCKQCGELFQPRRSTAVFCSDLCRIHNHRGYVNWS